jgi:hypothetical protein
MKILFFGDIVGNPGRDYLKKIVSQLRGELGLDFIIANGENSAGGSGITPDTARDIFNAGVDVITSGDHIFKKKEVREALNQMDILRPLNYGNAVWGRGYLIKENQGKKIGVINLMGRVFMQPLNCPFQAVREVLESIKKETRVIIVDMHAEATSEKLAMGYFLSGKASAVLGTHTHIPTADERILDGFSAYITDVGMTGSCDSILGREKYQVITKFVTNMPDHFPVASADVRAQGVVVEIEDDTGRAISIHRVEYRQDSEKR